MKWKNQKTKEKFLCSDQSRIMIYIPKINMHVTTVIITILAKPESLKKGTGTWS